MANLKMEAVLAFVKENAIYGDPQSVLDTIDTYAMDGSLDQKRFLMNIGPEKGKILVDTIKKNKSKKILELGSFLGYSAVLIGMTIDDDGELISVDPDPNSIAIASQLVEFAGLSSKVSFIKGKAEHAINDLDRSFDLIFISVSSRNSLIESIVMCFFGFFSWCITNPNPALESVNAGQNIGTLLSYAVSIKESFFLEFFFKNFPIS